MEQFWIPANKTLSLITRNLSSEIEAAEAICNRAHAGLVRAKANLFVIGEEKSEDALLPEKFWWAEGREALEQDWARGDFSTWIDHELPLKAFGVQFDFNGIRSMLPPEAAGAATRELSVATDPAWMSAKEATSYVFKHFRMNPGTVRLAIADYCRLGFLPARAVRMEQSTVNRSSVDIREWDIPVWLWEHFHKRGVTSQDWERGILTGEGRGPEGRFEITLTGVHFEAAALRSLSPAKPVDKSEASRGGRPRKEWWDDLWCSMWGDAYRGDFTPKTQAAIERRMLDWAEARGESVAESTVKPLARKMLAEMQREVKN